ncbi:hypothetical protein [Jatrophihabitans sp. GAS493]|uniref:hypothetical protein n=1 Tax=Jatrophihabitans sp. GAS493 TaxID=1907575 RepID=UPI001A7E18AF|nr:hypothetical protein [Jatrophihabitans sp. GAS493]
MTEIPAGRQALTIAIERGAVGAEQATKSGVRSLPEAGLGQTREDLALAAGSKALAAAGIEGSDVGLVIYSWTLDTNTDWKIAQRLSRQLGATHAVAVGLRQLCNGGAAGLHFAAAQLLTEPRLRHALVLTADALGPDAGRFWLMDEVGAAMGDAGTGLLLSRGGGALAVLSIASAARSDQEAWLPQNDRVPEISAGGDESQSVSAVIFVRRHGVRAAVDAALVDADLDPRDPDVAVVALPRLANDVTGALTDGMVRGRRPRRIVHLAEEGHLFAGDLTANVEHLLQHEMLAPGERALIINIGAGFTVTCVVVQAPGAPGGGKEGT